MVEDVSMRPRLEPGDRLLVDPSELGRRPPAPGEIVVFPDPDGSGRWLIKAVAAIGPAKAYAIRDGVEVRAAEDPRPPPADAIDGTDVPAGYVFAISTGATGGRDSRTFGPVPTSTLVGVVWWRYAPAPRTGPMDAR